MSVLFVLGTVALIKRQEAELELLRFSLGAMGMNRIKNKDIRGTVQVPDSGDKVTGGRTEMVWTCAEGQ